MAPRTPRTLTPRSVTGDGSTLVAYDFGAHLASWTVGGRPVVWCSPTAVLDGTRAIRGGIPICFPWFAAGPEGDHSPSHGPVRTAVWDVDQTRDDEVVAWRLSSADLAGAAGAELMPGPFTLRYAVSLTSADSSAASSSPAPRSPGLHVSLEVTSAAGEEITVEVALHTYLAVSDVRDIELRGLEDCDHLDKVSGTRARQDGPVGFSGEVDRVYDRSGTTVVQDVDGRAIVVEPFGATQTVVWNPGPEKGSTMADLGPDAWWRFVCVETAATADRAITLAPGQSHQIGCVIRPSGPRSDVTV
ncbi:D-hexose-6-phosphate mutarotase [Ornithinimicrobium panacihumi]|uniref:D-hexose-6-phosphate mutarotase n=1 Tax=Ornithinimicrobium panacihumi TaxID=2008449 RepID=UPI003F8BCA8E